MNILYMGYFCNEQVFNQLVDRGSHSSHARQQLETKLLNGLISEKHNNSLAIVSYLPEIREVRNAIGDGEIYREIDIRYTWCNKKNPISIIHAILKNRKIIKEWAIQQEAKAVITYSSNLIFVIPLLALRKKFHYKVVTLCSEVSLYRRKEGINLFTRLSRKLSSFLDNSFDGYILLTPYMNEIVNLKRRPCLIMEGIADESEQSFQVRTKDRSVILYAGGLTEDNGIKILLEGFLGAGCINAELSICGEGPLENLVKEYASQYDNIHFYGLLPNDMVRKMEREAALLVSPRFSKNKYTKYSFPSKIIEYLSSGSPVMLTRLAGIPEEYFQYVYVLEDETAQGMAELIQKIFLQEKSIREKMGKEAQDFVFQNKNTKVQAMRVFDFLQNLMEG